MKYRLGELIEVKHGWAFKGNYFSNIGNYLLLTPGNFHESGGLKLRDGKEKFYIGDFPKEFLLKKGDLLIVMTDLVQAAPILGGSAIVPEDNIFLHNQRLGKVIIKNINLIDKKYLYYLLNYQDYREQIKGSASGATVRHTAPERIYRYSINLPDLSSQKKIASVLSSFDDLIENNLKRIKLLEEAAELIYLEWFVNLRFPGHERVKIVDGVPEGWEIGKVEDFIDVAGGGTPSTENRDYWENGTIPWYTPTDLSKSKFLTLLKSEKLITESGLKGSSARLMKKNTILMTSRATIGLFGLVEHQYSTNQGFINIIPRNPEDKYYLLYNFKHRVEEIKGIATGATFLEISKSKFKSMDMIFPSPDILKKFFDTINPLFQLEYNLAKQIERMKGSRDLLLPRLMNGSINLEMLNDNNK